MSKQESRENDMKAKLEVDIVEITEEEYIRKLEEAYDKSRDNDEIVEESMGIFSYKNKTLREEIRNKYIATLPKDKRLAIELHKLLCKSIPCTFEYETTDNKFKDDWSQSEHRKYLSKAKRLLEIEPDESKIVKLVDIITDIEK